MKEPIVEAFKQEQITLEQERYEKEQLERGERLLAVSNVHSFVKFMGVIGLAAASIILMFGLISSYGG